MSDSHVFVISVPLSLFLGIPPIFDEFGMGFDADDSAPLAANP
jgi:hypothetical protein